MTDEAKPRFNWPDVHPRYGEPESISRLRLLLSHEIEAWSESLEKPPERLDLEHNEIPLMDGTPLSYRRRGGSKSKSVTIWCPGFIADEFQRVCADYPGITNWMLLRRLMDLHWRNKAGLMPDNYGLGTGEQDAEKV